MPGVSEEAAEPGREKRGEECGFATAEPRPPGSRAPWYVMLVSHASPARQEVSSCSFVFQSNLGWAVVFPFFMPPPSLWMPRALPSGWGKFTSVLDCRTQLSTHSGRLEGGWAVSGHQSVTGCFISDL